MFSVLKVGNVYSMFYSLIFISGIFLSSCKTLCSRVYLNYTSAHKAETTSDFQDDVMLPCQLEFKGKGNEICIQI
jgi:hypothetical protein